MPTAAPQAEGRTCWVPRGPPAAGFALCAWAKGAKTVLPDPTSCLPGRRPVVLRAVEQCPHIRLVPPCDIDHQHTCKVRGRGQMGTGVTQQ